MSHLAIIPARSGSKGLKDKNVKPLNRKPMMAYTIEAALNSGCFGHVIVSTDSLEYARIAEQYGAQVPYLRDASLSSDQASSWDVVEDVLGYYEQRGKTFETVCLLQPTSPLRTREDIVGAYNLMKEKEADSVVSVCETDHSPLWSNTLPLDLSLSGFISDDILSTPRQQLPVYYRLNGAIYLVKTSHLSDRVDLYHDRSYAYVMDKRHSIDIDDEMDFKIAEMLLN
ncbi:acylneuraminate cytidylyltransferase family protein [Jeotgalibacillus aurantiacus]|uniref:acylneuraminate cytidylyltransferase family protein n=1 Tax=Jeotgalibacillus aurantiacus TaxID=2763266 RepID=UPI001D0A7501|nr:acylneuraminate cytidylyltransferase family protein [Jeotgalibacillus aurantiacus]